MAIRTRSAVIKAGVGGMTGFRGQSEGLETDLKYGLNIRPSRSATWRKRPGTKLTHTAGGTTEIPTGLHFHYKLDGTEYILVYSSTGKLFNQSTLIHTFATASDRATFASFLNEVFISNSKDTPIKYDGSTVTQLTAIPTDWSGNSPFIFLAFNNRLWAVQRNSNRLWFSDLLKPDDFTGTGAGSLSVGGGGSIVAAYAWKADLYLFMSDGTVWLANVNDANVANWTVTKILGSSFRTPSPINSRCVIQTLNDMLFMDASGHIYSISTVIQSGEFARADITDQQDSRFIEYIQDNIDLSDKELPVIVYNNTENALMVFAKTKNASTTYNNIALVYYFNLGRWFVWQGELEAPSAYNDMVAIAMRSDGKLYVTRRGSVSNEIWTLDSGSPSDVSGASSSPIRAIIRSEIWNAGEPGLTKFIRDIRVVSSFTPAKFNFLVMIDGMIKRSGILGA